MKAMIMTFLVIYFIPFITSDEARKLTAITESDCGVKDKDGKYTSATDKLNCFKAPMKDYSLCCHANLAIPLCVEYKKDDNFNIQNGLYNGQLTCPEKSTIPNTCGIVGTMEPTEVKDCNKINIPESYCCLVDVKTTTKTLKACRRVDTFPSKKTDNKTIIEELKIHGSVEKIDCSSQFVKGVSSITCFLMIFLYIFFIE